MNHTFCRARTVARICDFAESRSGARAFAGRSVLDSMRIAPAQQAVCSPSGNHEGGSAVTLSSTGPVHNSTKASCEFRLAQTWTHGRSSSRMASSRLPSAENATCFHALHGAETAAPSRCASMRSTQARPGCCRMQMSPSCATASCPCFASTAKTVAAATPLLPQCACSHARCLLCGARATGLRQNAGAFAQDVVYLVPRANGLQQQPTFCLLDDGILVKVRQGPAEGCPDADDGPCLHCVAAVGSVPGAEESATC